MTKESLAAQLNGREYGNEMSDAEEAEAKKAGLVVIFGASDDLIELRGAISDEGCCFGGGTLKLDRAGILPPRSQIDDDEELKLWFKREPRAATVTAFFDKDGYTWTYEISRKHAPNAISFAEFEIVEDGEKYCRGLVIELKDLPSL